MKFKSYSEPFRHWISDDAFFPETVRDINSEWPEGPWNNHHHEHAKKRGNNSWASFGKETTSIIKWLNGEWFMGQLRELCRIPDLSADEKLIGGGLHETFCGGFLDIHADFNRHPDNCLYRRLNLMLFLNPEWKDEWNGHLELWDAKKTGCKVRIAPIGGRCVIFETAPDSFHGHPEKLACPEGVSRRSIALYYYSAEPGRQISKEHSTLYLGDEEKWPEDARQCAA